MIAFNRTTPNPVKVEGLDLSRFPLKMTLYSFVQYYYGSPRLSLGLYMDVVERDGTGPLQLTFARDFDTRDPRPDSEIAYEFVRECVLHELEESWLENGWRTRDPHMARPGGI